jgi:hypothetical protein
MTPQRHKLSEHQLRATVVGTLGRSYETLIRLPCDCGGHILVANSDHAGPDHHAGGMVVWACGHCGHHGQSTIADILMSAAE